MYNDFLITNHIIYINIGKYLYLSTYSLELQLMKRSCDTFFVVNRRLRSLSVYPALEISSHKEQRLPQGCAFS